MECPKCGFKDTYQIGYMWNCSKCYHEWTSENEIASKIIHLDANGNILDENDSITVIKDLKVKGSSSIIKQGTKIKNFKLVETSDDHNISCKIKGIGAVNITSKFVKKLK